MPEIKCYGAEESTIYNFYKIGADQPTPTTVFHINRSRQKCSLYNPLIFGISKKQIDIHYYMIVGKKFEWSTTRNDCMVNILNDSINNPMSHNC